MAYSISINQVFGPVFQQILAFWFLFHYNLRILFLEKRTKDFTLE